jgi:hypothetical protein
LSGSISSIAWQSSSARWRIACWFLSIIATCSPRRRRGRPRR